MARYTEIIYPVKKLVALTAELAEAIGEFRHRQRISSEAEAIRRLIEVGLAAHQRPTAEAAAESAAPRRGTEA